MRGGVATTLLIGTVFMLAFPVQPANGLILNWIAIVGFILDLFLSCSKFDANVDCPEYTLPAETDVPDTLTERFDDLIPSAVDIILSLGLVDEDNEVCRQAIYDWSCTLGHGYVAGRCRTKDGITELLPCKSDCQRFMDSGCIDLDLDKTPIRQLLDNLEHSWFGFAFKWFIGDYFDTPERLICNFLNDDTLGCKDLDFEAFLPTLEEAAASRRRSIAIAIGATFGVLGVAGVIIGSTYMGYLSQNPDQAKKKKKTGGAQWPKKAPKDAMMFSGGAAGTSVRSVGSKGSKGAGRSGSKGSKGSRRSNDGSRRHGSQGSRRQGSQGSRKGRGSASARHGTATSKGGPRTA